MKLSSFLTLWLIFVFKLAFGQDSTTFSINDFYNQLAFHPLVLQSNLVVSEAKKELQYSRGGFDPSINSEYLQKDFSGKNYYTLWNNALKIPTWLGPDLKIGYENNTGGFLNQENNVPNTGLFSAGISVPIGRGLLIDQRRALLRQSKIGVSLSEFEKTKLLNKLYLDATKSYFDWVMAFNVLKINQFFYGLALERKNAIVAGVTVGESAPIDSVEINIELQRREISLINAQIELNNTRLLLSNHLWAEGTIPLEIDEKVIPESLDKLTLAMETTQIMGDSVINFHPELLKLTGKIQQLKFEKRLAAENLKPQLNIDFNPIFTTFNNNIATSGYITSNYKLGATFYAPIFIRKERAKLSLVKIKTEQVTQQINFTKRDLTNQLKASEYEVRNYKQLAKLQENNTQQIQVLRDAENTNFSSGESNVFLVNTRERNLIDGQQKLIEYKLKYLKSIAEYRYHSGVNILDLIK